MPESKCMQKDVAEAVLKLGFVNAQQAGQVASAVANYLGQIAEKGAVAKPNVPVPPPLSSPAALPPGSDAAALQGLPPVPEGGEIRAGLEADPNPHSAKQQRGNTGTAVQK